MFPSLAPQAATSSLTPESGTIFQARKVVNVTVDGARYEVGPGVSLSGAYNTGRALAEDYVTTPNYAALLAGALFYSGATEIERLVLGLPVHNTQKYGGFLRDRFVGRHDFGWGEVNVKSVMPLPQPLGTLVANARSIAKTETVEVAVVPPGYATLEEALSAKNSELESARSALADIEARRQHIEHELAERAEALDRRTKAGDALTALVHQFEKTVAAFATTQMAVQMDGGVEQFQSTLTVLDSIVGRLQADIRAALQLR